MTEAKKRDAYFDNAKFILILLVVIGHVIEPLRNRSTAVLWIYNVIYFFHMPSFIMIVGYFMKYIKNPEKYVKKYFLAYMLIQTTYYVVLDLLLGQDLAFSYAKPYWSYWFLVSVAAWYILFPYIENIKKLLPISIIVAVLVGFDNNIDSVLSLSRIFVFFPYFLIGYGIQEHQIHQFQKGRSKYVLLIGCVMLAWYLLSNDLINMAFVFGRASYHAMEYGLVKGSIFRLLTYVLCVLFSFTFFAFVPTKKSFYTKLGMQTLPVYLIHGLFLKVLKALGFYSMFHTYGSYALLITASIAFTVVVTSIAARMSWIKKYNR